ncbi:MAG: protein phosphatase [Lachnospiraceae bacterium]|nr:protein phosphatase [Lachnospiraceae bacterium]
MDEDMNNSEMIRDLAEENQTRKILELLNESQDIEEAKKKVKDLLEK